MMDRRICRACGCWERRACMTEDGPCAWLAADRCSACPTAPLTLPINEAHVKAGGFQLIMHLNMGREGHAYTYRSVTYPALQIYKHSKRGQWVERSASVGSIDVRWGEWATAAELLNQLERKEAA